jgi:outer membrane PBP1 activator LpoA protein
MLQELVLRTAQPAHGRSIKPTLDFFYAHDLPVYATSHLYTGIEDTNLNRDLDGIRFSAMPWTLPGMVSDHLLPDSKLQSSYRHLYALGIDAYQLHQRLGLMQASPEAQFYGHTGVLTVSAEGVITRRQPWAEFRRGRVRPAPTLTEN